jgi:hypothetical protein
MLLVQVALGGRSTRLKRRMVGSKLISIHPLIIPSIDPGLAEMCLRLTETEKKKTGQLSGSINILTEGLNIEQAQCVIIFTKYGPQSELIMC